MLKAAVIISAFEKKKLGSIVYLVCKYGHDSVHHKPY